MNKTFVATLALAFMTLSFGCRGEAEPEPNAKVTKANYEKIELGMSPDEVKSILGDSWKISQTGNLEMKGVGVAAIREWSAGKGSGKSVELGFKDGKVAAKNATGF